VFLNGAAEPLSPDHQTVLADGDEIRLGDYVITVSDTADPATTARPADTLGEFFATPPGGAFAYPLVARLAVRQDDPFDRADEMLSPGPSQGLPNQRMSRAEDLFKGDEPLDVWQGPSQPDNADAPVHAVAEPRFVAGPRFDDLDIDALLGDIPPGQATPAPLPAPAAPPAAVLSSSAPSGPAASGPGPSSPPPFASVLPSVDAGSLLAAFLEGAGVPALNLDPGTDPHTALRAAGEVFHAMVEGLREVLMSRAAVKQEFRTEQTMLGPCDNNPLKFSITAEDAVAALLRPGRRGYQPPLVATREAFADLKSHELAVMAGAQTALVGLLRRINPAVMEEQQRTGPGCALLPVARKARCWELFRTTYKDIARAAEDDFQSAFGRDFARAYEAQARQL
jgi:type VI secretion system FHA domain protein